MDTMKVAFIGHRNIEVTPSLTGHIDLFLENLICENGARHFIFGSKSMFNDLCYKHVTKWRGCVRSIVREYVRADHEYLTDKYRDYLDERFEMTDYPYELCKTKANPYLVRNKVMIDRCDFLFTYYDKNKVLQEGGHSGTQIAVEYARKQKKPVLNIFEYI